MSSDIIRHAGRLTHAEVQARGAIGMTKRKGGNVALARARFEQLKAERELIEAAERLVEARAVQGLAPKISDPATLARIVRIIDSDVLLASPEKKRTVDVSTSSTVGQEGADDTRPAA